MSATGRTPGDTEFLGVEVCCGHFTDLFPFGSLRDTGTRTVLLLPRPGWSQITPKIVIANWHSHCYFRRRNKSTGGKKRIKTQTCPGWDLSAEKQRGKEEIQSSKNHWKVITNFFTSDNVIFPCSDSGGILPSLDWHKEHFSASWCWCFLKNSGLNSKQHKYAAHTHPEYRHTALWESSSSSLQPKANTDTSPVQAGLGKAYQPWEQGLKTGISPKHEVSSQLSGACALFWLQNLDFHKTLLTVCKYIVCVC